MVELPDDFYFAREPFLTDSGGHFGSQNLHCDELIPLSVEGK
jgi:hypothetical protein